MQGGVALIRRHCLIEAMYLNLFKGKSYVFSYTGAFDLFNKENLIQPRNYNPT